MTKLEKIEKDVEGLSTDDLARFREWFAVFDAEKWDAEIKADAASGRLDALGEQALSAHHAKRTTLL
jgi:hypothetical protein